MPKLYSYVVARDYGFAPNPFYGFCTLAACKPQIRQAAQAGDWIVGTGSKTKGRDGCLVYAMLVGEALSFDEYWNDPRFWCKRPNLRGSLKQAYGDNIYHQDPASGLWLQADSHHSFENGRQNPPNTQRDTRANRVLIGDDFVYWGGSGPVIPDFRRVSICKIGPNHKSDFPGEVVAEFVNWIRSAGDWGYCGAPLEWNRPPP